MDNDRKLELEDKIREYRTQFEESMASIAAYHERAVVEMAELRALHAEIAAEQKKTDEQQKKTDEQMQKTDEQQKKTDLKVRELNTNWGRFVESLVEGDLVRLLNRRGIKVHRSACRVEASYPLDDGTRRHREFDIVVANGEEVVVVEVKTTLRPDDVDRFVDTMRDVARYLPEYASSTVYGAVAYIRCESKTKEYADQQGLYVIRATGNSASIVNDENFKPESFTNTFSRRPHGHLRAVPAI